MTVGERELWVVRPDEVVGVFSQEVPVISAEEAARMVGGTA
jgi:hypothetical protein